MNLSKEIDAVAHAKARNHPATTPWIRTKGHTTAQEQEAWFKDQPYFWSVQEGKDFIGMVGFTSVTKHDAEFSCLIYPEHRGKAYGFKALEQLFDYGFYAMKLDLIYGNTYGYAASQIDFPPPENALEIYINEIGHVYLNPAFKLFQKFNMTIAGPCLYPRADERTLTWKLTLPRYVYNASLA